MATVDDTIPRTRRLPQQARSRERIQRVLDTAEQLLIDEGPEALSTSRVAQLADISVGSLYQWFPDKHAIAEALALRYVEAFKGVAADFAVAVQRDPRPPADVAVMALDVMAGAFRAQPGYRALWFSALRTEALRDATRPGLQDIAISLGRALAACAPAADLARVQVVARMIVQVADALLRQAFRAHPTGDAEVLEETRTLIRVYVADQLHASAT